MRFCLITLCLLGLITLIPAAAVSQEIAPPSEAGLEDLSNPDPGHNNTATQIPQSLPAENPKAENGIPSKGIPDSYLREADAFFKYCQSTPKFEEYFDCECLAAEFLGRRIEVGPDAARTSIMSNIDDRCLDATDAAGMQYQTCLGNGALLPNDIPIEEYCSCYANEYAKIFENLGISPDSRSMIQMQSAAHMRCRGRR